MNSRTAIYDYLIDWCNAPVEELEVLNDQPLFEVYQFAKSIAENNGEASVLEDCLALA